MNDQVILVIGTSKFLMNLEEALSVASTLNSCNRIVNKWVSSGNKEVIGEPALDASSIVPMTAYLQITLENNAKEDKK